MVNECFRHIQAEKGDLHAKKHKRQTMGSMRLSSLRTNLFSSAPDSDLSSKGLVSESFSERSSAYVEVDGSSEVMLGVQRESEGSHPKCILVLEWI